MTGHEIPFDVLDAPALPRGQAVRPVRDDSRLRRVLRVTPAPDPSRSGFAPLPLAAAGVVGFIGNEIAAVIRLRAGSRLDSPSLVADGYHARTDGYVSLGVVASAALVALGAEVADPLIGLAIGRHPAHCVAVLADDQTRHTRSLSPPCARSFSQPLVPAGLERRPSGDTPGPLSTDRNEKRRSTR